MTVILAIETSCDETGLSIVETTHKSDAVEVAVRADVLFSQAQLHAQYGGVYPALAKREHAKNLVPLFVEALTKAGFFVPSENMQVNRDAIGTIKEILEREPELFVHLAALLAQIEKPPIDAIAVTSGPGLEPALWVGINFARALGSVWNIPVVPINHMEGHVIAGLARQIDKTHFTITRPVFPALSLLISGGHTELVLMRSWLEYEKIGTTRDDAVGEAFDKSARLLGLSYPGGPQISKLAEAARVKDLAQPFSLPRPMLHTDDYDFSFSGLKTAVRNLVTDVGVLNETQKKQLARELEDAIAEVLLTKTQHALDAYAIKTLIIGGGVSANTHLRREFENCIAKYPEVTLSIPAPDLATDNGRMIAFAAAIHDTATAQQRDIRANGNWRIDAPKDTV